MRESFKSKEDKMKKIRLLLCAILAFTLCVLMLVSCEAETNSLGEIRFDHDTQSISWDKVKGAVGYRVTVGNRDKIIRNSTSYALDFLDPGEHTVYVRVIAMDGSESEAKTYEYKKKEESGLVYKLINGNTEYQLIGVGSASGDVVMESVFRNKPVTSIAASALAHNDKITSFVIGSNVTEIPKKAFYNAKNLVSVTIPDNVTKIGENAFQSCASLKSVKLPDGVTEIPPRAFIYCRALESVTLGTKTVKIGEYAFSDCSALKSIALPESVTHVGDSAFSACESVTSLTLGSNIETIGELAFFQLKLLNKVTLPESLRTLGVSAFEECTALESIDFPQKLITVGDRAFALCEKLDKVTFNATGVESIGRDILDGTPFLNNYEGDIVYLGSWIIKCKNEKIGENQDITAYLKNDVIGIADYAFYKCNLFTAIILDDVVHVGKYAFAKCLNLHTVKLGENAKIIDNFAFYDCEKLRNVIIDNTSLESIGDFAFYSCTKLADVALPKTIKMIGSRAFSSTSVSPDPNGVVYVGNWIVGCTNEYVTDVNIREGTVGIAEYSFYPCEFLVSVKMPNSLETIGKGAFLLCEMLNIEAFPASLKTIGDYAFYGCKQAKFGTGYQLILPDGLLSIGRSAFYASSVCGVIIPGSCKTIGDYAFYGCSMLGSNVTFNVPPTEEGEEPSTFEQRYYIYILPGVESIGAYAFHESGIIDIAIPDSVTFIGERAFFQCPNLTSVKLGSGIKEIPEYCFYGCEKLESLIISEGTEVIGNGAFRLCKSLKNMSLASTVTTIGDTAFMGCESLEALTLPTSLTKIGSGAFRSLKSLTSIILPSSVTEIGSNAFYGCNALTIYTNAKMSSDKKIEWNTSWRPIVFGCTLSENSDSVIFITVGDSIVNSNALGGISALPKIAGYEFKGWSTTSQGSVEYEASEITSAPAGTTLYAIWQELKAE